MKIFNVFHHPAAGIALLRITLAILILLHGIAKITGGVGFISGMLVPMGLPSWLAYGAYVGEVIAPILLLVNRLVVPAALVIAINMLFAFGLVHMGDLFSRSGSGGWALELQGMFLVAAIVVALTAPRTDGR